MALLLFEAQQTQESSCQQLSGAGQHDPAGTKDGFQAGTPLEHLAKLPTGQVT